MTGRKKGLDEKHRKILEFIEAFIRDSGYPPTHKEISEGTGLSTSSVKYKLSGLVELAYIETDSNVSRGIRLLKNVSGQMSIDSSPFGRSNDLLNIPIVGRIFASIPVPVPSSDFSYSDSDSIINLPKNIFPKDTEIGELFALEVQGDSMIDALVGDGDIVVMQRSSNAINGEMVAVWLPDRDETTLKYYFREKNYVRLQPANPTMGPIYVDDPSMVKIQGKVVIAVRQVSSGLQPYDDNGVKTITNGDSREIRSRHTIVLSVLEKIEGVTNLTPIFLGNSISPFLGAINHIQNIANQIQKLPSADIVIFSISQNSPITINLGNAKDAIDAIRSIIVPWRRRHAEQMALLAERKEKIEIEKNKVAILEINAQRKKIEDDKALERDLKREEIRKIQLENERTELEIQREKIKLALEIIAKIGPHLSEHETSQFVTELIPTITVLVSSDIEIKSPATNQ